MVKDFEEAQGAAQDPQRFVEIIEYIAKLPETREGRRKRDALLRVFESVVTEATFGINISEDLTNAMSAMVSADVPAILATASGQIIRLNDHAMQRHPEVIFGTLQDLNIQMDQGESLVGAFGKPSLGQRMTPEVKFFDAIDLNANRPVQISVNRVKLPKVIEPALLVSFFERSGEARVRALMEGKGLTQAETEVVTRFIDGLSLAQIAKERARSPETVRRQFYTALEKAGYASQADLLRDLLFQFQVPLSAPAVAEPSNTLLRNLSLPLPGGRILDVSMSGDFSGRPLVFPISNSGGHLPTVLLERFKQRGILVLNIARPGFGATSLPLDGQTEEDCFVSDTTALLRQLQIEEFSLFGAGLGCLPAIRLARSMDKRVRSIFATAIIPPRPFAKSTDDNDPGQLDLSVAFNLEAELQSVRYQTLLWYGTQVGWKKALEKIATNNPKMIEYAMLPQNLASAESGFNASVAQGFDRAVKDQSESHGNWLPDLDACPCQIYLLQATDDLFYPIQSVRALVNHAPDKFVFSEVPGTCVSAHIDYPDRFIEVIEQALNHRSHKPE